MNLEMPLSRSEEIFEDRDGFIWIGTINGLVKYNGHSITTFRHSDDDSTSLAANNINAIGQDASGRIWVGCRKFGISILNIQQEGFIHPCLPDEKGVCQSGLSINAICQASDSTMWVGSDDGLYLFSSTGVPSIVKVYRTDFTSTYGLHDDFILHIYQDRKGQVWIGTNRGIALFDQIQGRFINHQSNPSFPSAQTLDIIENEHGVIWVATRYVKESLQQYDEQSQSFKSVLPDRNPYSGEYKIAFDSQDDAWITARGDGLYYFDMPDGRQTYFDPKDYKHHGYRNVYSVNSMKDQFGNIWITGDHLLKRPATGKAFSSIHTDENMVFSIYADTNSIWYSAPSYTRFDRYSNATMSIFSQVRADQYEKSLQQQAAKKIVYSAQRFDDEQVLFLTTKSVFKWNTETNRYREFPFQLGGPLRDFVITQDHRHLWICGNQGSPLFFDLETGHISSPEYISPIRNPRCVAQGRDGNLWFGSVTAGLYFFDIATREIENFTPDHHDASKVIADYYVNDIAVTEHNIWVATNSGLDCIDRITRKVKDFHLSSSFADVSCMSILEDNSGILWIGTQKGLIRYDPADTAVYVYDREDGLLNTVYAAGSCFKDLKGTLYFGGDQGIDYFDPEYIGKNEIPPKLLLGAVTVNAKPCEWIGRGEEPVELNFTYQQNFIDIELLGLHYTAPHAISYAYRIMELDTVWRFLGHERRITLAGMRPGNYTLQARAANADDIWCQDKTLLYFTISPPFWARWWFVTGSLLFFLFLLRGAYLYHIKQVTSRERIRSDFKKQLLELESKALRSQMNPHFLFNSLNSIKSMISQGNNAKATAYITRFAQLMRQILANSELPMVRLQEELEALRLYLEIEQLRFQNFNYEILIQEEVNTDFIEIPPLVLQPYVENAIWHGLMPLASPDRRLKVSVAIKSDRLHLTIEDNGIGREQAQRIKPLGNARKGGLGMKLTEERLGLVKAIYGQEVKVNITDLMSGDKPAGTRIEISLPYSD